MNEILVELTPNEIHLAASHGLLRRFEKLQGKRTDRMQKCQSDWVNEIEGACAELAWAKLRAQFWTGVSGLHAKDGVDVEVRWTRREDGGLIVYPHDRDDAVFVLAKGFAPNYRFVGWLRGSVGKQIGRLTDFGYLVPASQLRDLPESLR